MINRIIFWNGSKMEKKDKKPKLYVWFGKNHKNPLRQLTIISNLEEHKNLKLDQ